MPENLDSTPIDYQVAKIAEPLITLPDKRIGLVAMKHGHPEDPFSYAPILERDLEMLFCDHKINAFMPDSLPRLEQNIPLITKALDEKQTPPDQATFLEWAIQQSAQHNLYLIGGDPISFMPALWPFTAIERTSMEGGPTGPYYEEWRQKYSQVIASPEYRMTKGTKSIVEMTEDKAADAAALATTAFGIYILYGLAKNMKMDRRQFLKMLGVGGIGLAASIGSGWASKKIVQLQLGLLKTVIEKRQDRIWQRESPELDAEQQQASQFKMSDKVKMDELFSQSGFLTAEDYQTPEYLRQAAHMEGYIVGNVFRNAVFAAVLDLPSEEIFPQLKPKSAEKMNIAGIYGYNHFVVPEKRRISWFLSHPEERDRIIKELMQALKRSWQDNIIAIENVTPTDEEFRKNFSADGSSYLISEDGELTRHNFTIPSLTE